MNRIVDTATAGAADPEGRGLLNVLRGIALNDIVPSLSCWRTRRQHTFLVLEGLH